jgi:hypothetical protein
LINVFIVWFSYESSNMRSYPPHHVILSNVRRQPNESKDPITLGIGMDDEKFSTTEHEMNGSAPYPKVAFFATLGWDRSSFSK